MLQDCKYRLPCNWCDKYDRMCEAVLFEIHKEEQEKNVGRPEPKEKECEHEWRYEGQLGNRHHYKCIKCDTLKAVPLENLYTTNKKCDHQWAFDKTTENTGGTYTHYYCRKCGAMMMRDSTTGITYESGEWKP